MWLLALVPLYLAIALLIARFCQLNSRYDESMLDYFSVLEAERRAEEVLDRARASARMERSLRVREKAASLEAVSSAR